MKLVFEPLGWADYLYWHESDRKMSARINAILNHIVRSPFKGLGKPEPLRQNLSGLWSRRIDGEHRLIYRIVGAGDEQRLEVVQCRGHYHQ